MEPNITTPEKFAKDIEDIIWKFDIGYFEAVLHYLELNEIEIESVNALLKGNARIKEAIREEVEELNFLPKTNRIKF